MKFRQTDSKTPAFNRNPQLHTQYCAIGSALLVYEDRFLLIPAGVDERAHSDFRIAVSFVPNILLDSYLEDLLDPGVSETDLWIRRRSISFRSALPALPWIGVLAAFGCGFLMTDYEISLSLCVLATVILCLPFCWLATRIPKPTNRRMAFARLLNYELSQRRGNRGGDQTTTKIQFKDILVPNFSRSGPQGIVSRQIKARMVVH